MVCFTDSVFGQLQEKYPGLSLHLSTNLSYVGMSEKAVELGVKTYQFFAQNPRKIDIAGGLDKIFADSTAFLLYNKEHSISPVIHEPLVSNLASSEHRVSVLSSNVLLADLKRAHILGVPFIIAHPGSNPDASVRISCLAKALISAYTRFFAWRERSSFGGIVPCVCIETMAGSGNLLCSKPSEFEELFSLLNGSEVAEYVKICFDTAHVFAAYGIRPFISDLEKFGLSNKVGVVHFNDSSAVELSKKDRHAIPGKGLIPASVLDFVFEYFDDRSKILEVDAESLLADIR